jgi:hypothetical protein
MCIREVIGYWVSEYLKKEKNVTASGPQQV